MPKKSKIQLLPQDIKQELDAMLRDGRLTQQEILEIVNQMVLESEHANYAFTIEHAEPTISRSGLNRYAQSMEKAGEKIRQARAMADQWIEKNGTSDNTPRLAIEVARTMVFDWIMKHQDDELDSKAVREASQALMNLEKAASENVKREEQIRENERKRILEDTQKQMKQSGISADAFEAVKKSILGVG